MNTPLDLSDMKIRNILIGAMGGSAISANVVVGSCSKYLPIPMTINKTPIIPGWVGPETLTLISTYSGNTDETLEMYNRAKAAGSPIIVLTSGGKVEQMAADDGYLVLKIPTGFQPRYSSGYMIGYCAAILSALGYPQFSENVRECLPRLRNYRNYLETQGSLAYLLAEKYKDNVIVICTESMYRPVAYRWKSEFNENAKTICFDSALSELDNFETEPWASYKGGKLRIILIAGERDMADDSLLRRAVANLEDLRLPFDLVAVVGMTHEERLLRAWMLGDYVTVYIAEIFDIDPEITTVISELKNRIRNGA
jgi:glucose/mannose-6-phosphate isomerase